MEEVKHVFAVYTMEPGYDGDEIKSATPSMIQRFWVDEDVALADFGDIATNLKINKPPFEWAVEHCISMNQRLYIEVDKVMECILDLKAKDLIDSELSTVIWYGQLVTGQMKFNAVNAFKAEILRFNTKILRSGLPFEPGEDEVISDGIGGDEF